MYRILLELNHLSLLRRFRPHLVGEITHRLESIGRMAASVSGSVVDVEVEDAPAEEIARSAWDLLLFLRSRRLKLHGFLLAVDYARSGDELHFSRDSSWGAVSGVLEELIVSEGAAPLLSGAFDLRDNPAGRLAGGLRIGADESVRSFEESADPSNRALIGSIVEEWRSAGARPRPVYLHGLAAGEQYRLARAAAVEAGCADYFPLVDLNYPWRSPAGAWLSAFGPDGEARLAGALPEERRREWRRLGEALFSSLDIFCEEDALAWLGLSLSGWARTASAEGGIPLVAVVGVENLNRRGRTVMERLIAPMHRRGLLFAVCLGAAVPRRRRPLYGWADFRRAPGPGEAFLGSPADSVDLEIAALLRLFGPLLECDTLRSALYTAGYAKHRVDLLLSSLVRTGHAFRTWRYVLPPLREGTAAEDSFSASGILEPFLSAGTGSGRDHLLAEFAAVAARYLPEAGEKLFRRLAGALYECGFSHSGEPVLSILARLPREYDSLKKTAAVLASGEFADYRVDAAGGDSLGEALYIESLIRSGEEQAALNTAKSFLFRVQEAGRPCEIARAQNAIGKGMLRQGRIEEANDYFALSYETSKSCESAMDKLKARLNRALSLFLFGNYSRSARLLEEARAAAAGMCHGPYLLFAAFLKGRIEFVLGRYREAEREMWRALSLATLTGAPHGVFYAWIGRSRIYAGEFESGLKLLDSQAENAELLYYRAEGHYFGGDQQRALAAVRRADLFRRRGEAAAAGRAGFDWENGYRTVEDMALRSADGRGVLDNCICAFRWFLESRSGGTERGREVLEEITRGERLSELDPHLHYYFLIQAQLIDRETHDETLERITYLSKGLKYLQRIGSVVDEVPARLDFLQKNRWNRYLMELARQEKLA